MNGSMLGRLAASGVIELIETVSRLPHVSHPLVIYPDVSPKPYGFPNGIALRTNPGWLYPLSAPDLGCGFEVIDTGIELDRETPATQKAELLHALRRGVGSSSRDRAQVKISITEILHNGLQAMSKPVEFDRLNPGEESNTWPASTVLFSSSDLNTIQAALGAATGHFVAIHVVRERYAEHALPVGRVIAVIHTGAAPVRDLLNARQYMLNLAEWSVQSGLIEPEHAASGMFPIPLGSFQGRQFAALAMACRNFGYANREIVAGRVLRILSDVFSGRQIAAAVELRHVDHVAFEGEPDTVLARRGLQPLHPHRPSFIAGGAFSHGYLCETPEARVPWGHLSPHGNPVLPKSIMQPEVARAVETGQYQDQGYGRDLASNIDFDEDQYLADTFSLEDLMCYMTAIGWSRRTALLSPLVNFQDSAG